MCASLMCVRVFVLLRLWSPNDNFVDSALLIHLYVGRGD